MKTNLVFTFLLSYFSYLFVDSNGIAVNDFKYEEIVVSIESTIPRDKLSKIIATLKEMFEAASTYLNQTTNRFAFQSVIILVPRSLKDAPGVNLTKDARFTKSPDDADFEVILASDGTESRSAITYTDVFGPYTVQHGECGERGRRVYIPHSFLLNPSAEEIYGKRHRVLVHEWAHYRYGVFDEHGYVGDPFYPPFYTAAGINFYQDPREHIIATSCTDQTLKYLIRPHYFQCIPDKGTGRPPSICSLDARIHHEENREIKSSLMFHQALPSMSAFCNAETHSILSQTKHNAFCSLKSVMEVIDESPDTLSVSRKGPRSEDTVQFTVILDNTINLRMLVDSMKPEKHKTKVHANLLIEAFDEFSRVAPEGSIFTPVVYLKRRSAMVELIKGASYGGTLEARMKMAKNYWVEINKYLKLVALDIDSCLICQFSHGGTKRWLDDAKMVAFLNVGNMDITDLVRKEMAMHFVENRIRFHLIHLYDLGNATRFNVYRSNLAEVVRVSSGHVYTITFAKDDKMYPTMTQQMKIITHELARKEASATIVQVVDKVVSESSYDGKTGVSFWLDESLFGHEVIITLSAFPSFDLKVPAKDFFVTKVLNVKKEINYQRNTSSLDVRAVQYESIAKFLHEIVDTGEVAFPSIGKWAIFYNISDAYYKNPVTLSVTAANWKHVDQARKVTPVVMEVWTNYEMTIKSYGKEDIDPSNASLPGAIVYVHFHDRGVVPVSKARLLVTVRDEFYRETQTFEARDDGQGDPDITKGDGIYSAYVDVAAYSAKGGHHYLSVTMSQLEMRYCTPLAGPLPVKPGFYRSCCGSFGCFENLALHRRMQRTTTYAKTLYVKPFGESERYKGSAPNRILDLKISGVQTYSGKATLTWSPAGTSYTHPGPQDKDLSYDVRYVVGDKHLVELAQQMDKVRGIVDTWAAGSEVHENMVKGKFRYGQTEEHIFFVSRLKGVSEWYKNRTVYIALRAVSPVDRSRRGRASNIVALSLKSMGEANSPPPGSKTPTRAPSSGFTFSVPEKGRSTASKDTTMMPTWPPPEETTPQSMTTTTTVDQNATDFNGSVTVVERAIGSRVPQTDFAKYGLVTIVAVSASVMALCICYGLCRRFLYQGPINCCPCLSWRWACCRQCFVQYATLCLARCFPHLVETVSSGLQGMQRQEPCAGCSQLPGVVNEFSWKFFGTPASTEYSSTDTEYSATSSEYTSTSATSSSSTVE